MCGGTCQGPQLDASGMSSLGYCASFVVNAWLLRLILMIPTHTHTVLHTRRCETTNFSNWQQEVPATASGCPVVFCADATDPAGVDVYTNAWTPYPSITAPDAVHLFFPSFYEHFSASAPYGFGNDGLLDIRLVTTRDLESNLSYVPARNGRSPFVPLGINKCGLLCGSYLRAVVDPDKT